MTEEKFARRLAALVASLPPFVGAAAAELAAMPWGLTHYDKRLAFVERAALLVLAPHIASRRSPIVYSLECRVARDSHHPFDQESPWQARSRRDTAAEAFAEMDRLRAEDASGWVEWQVRAVRVEPSASREPVAPRRPPP